MLETAGELWVVNANLNDTVKTATQCPAALLNCVAEFLISFLLADRKWYFALLHYVRLSLLVKCLMKRSWIIVANPAEWISQCIRELRERLHRVS